MAIKIKRMQMPKSCKDCSFLTNSDGNSIIYKEVKIGGKCRALQIKDFEGEIIDYQVIFKNANCIEKYTIERSPLCPLILEMKE